MPAGTNRVNRSVEVMSVDFRWPFRRTLLAPGPQPGEASRLQQRCSGLSPLGKIDELVKGRGQRTAQDSFQHPREDRRCRTGDADVERHGVLAVDLADGVSPVHLAA